MLLKSKQNNDLLNMINRKGGKLPTKKEAQLSKEVLSKQIRDNNDILFKIPENFYKDLDYDISIIITGEEEDTRAQTANLQVLLQAVMNRPDMFPKEAVKRILDEIADKSGIDMADIYDEKEEGEEQPQPNQIGGGMSIPSMPNTPQRQQTTRRV